MHNASMAAPTLNLKRSLGWSIALLAAVFALFELSPLDLWVQDRLFVFEAGAWLIDGREPIGRALLYTGPKAIIIALGCFLLASTCMPARVRSRLPQFLQSRKKVLFAVVAMGLIPALVGWLKATTNVFCPSELRRYGGDVPYVRVVERYTPEDKPVRRGRCFPAGHASGGFALFALAGLSNHRRGQLTGIAIGLFVGSIMGFYQMAKGAHYLSHAVITALVAWLMCVGLYLLAGERSDRLGGKWSKETAPRDTPDTP